MKDPVGRLADMRSACRQLAAFPGHHLAAVVAAWNDEIGAPSFFISGALLFGEASAAFGLNRVSRFLHPVACKGFVLVVTGYYDDFSQREAARLAVSAEASFKWLIEATRF